jgi:hypothetical protein
VRTIIFVVAALVALPLTSVYARADGAWCAYYSSSCCTNCGFHSYEQCMANVSGVGGYCQRNPLYPASTDSRRRKQRYD